MYFIQAFDFEKPKESLDAVFKHFKKCLSVDDDLVSFFKERASIEERYAADLAKLAKKGSAIFVSEKSSSNLDTSKSLIDIWETLIQATTNKSKSHSSLATSIVSNVEGAFKARSEKHEEWGRVKQGTSVLSANYDNDFQKATKEFQEKLNKMDAKLKKRGAEDKKVQEALAAIDTVKAQWSSEAATMFQKYERMERDRIEYYKKTLIEFLDLDSLCHQSVASAILDFRTKLLSFDPDDELVYFCKSEGTRKNSVIRSSSHIPPAETIPASDNVTSLLDTPTPATFSSPVSSSLTPSTQRMSIMPSLTSSKSAAPIVDSEGYSVRPPEASDIWGASPPGDDDDFDTLKQPKIKVQIQPKAVEDHDQEEKEVVLKDMMSRLATTKVLASNRRTRKVSVSTSEVLSTGNNTMSSTPATVTATSTAIVTPATALPINKKTFLIPCNVSETLNVLFKGAAVQKILVAGEINIAVPVVPAELASNSVEIIVSHRNKLERFIPNTEFITHHETKDGSQPMEREERLILNLNALIAIGGSTIAIAKYAVSCLPEEAIGVLPLVLDPVWKLEEHQASLLLRYTIQEAWLSRLSALSIVVGVQDGGDIGSVQTKPAGLWDLDSRVLVWDLSQALHGPDAHSLKEGQLLARLETSCTLVPLLATCVFSCQGHTLSGVSVKVPKTDTLTLSVESLVSFQCQNGSYGSDATVLEN